MRGTVHHGRGDDGQVRVWIGSLLLVVLLVLAACGGGSQGGPSQSGAGSTGSTGTGTSDNVPSETADESDEAGITAETIEAIEAAAIEEGEFLFYTTMSENHVLEILAAFHEDYPQIKGNVFRQAIVDLSQRFFAENQANNNVADVVSFSDFGITQAAIDAGLFDQWLPPGIEEYYDSQFLDPNGYYHVHQLGLFTIVINTNLVPPDKIPSTYMDLLDPWWEGKVGIVDARINGAGYLAYWGISQVAGREYWAQLYDMGARIYEQTGQLKNALAAGEVAAAIMVEYHGWELLADGAPVKIVFPDEGLGGFVHMLLIPKNAPHKNAGKLFAWWLSTERGAEVHARVSQSYVPRKGAPLYPGPADGRRPLDEITVLTDFAQAEAEKDAFRAYLEQVWRQ